MKIWKKARTLPNRKNLKMNQSLAELEQEEQETRVKMIRTKTKIKKLIMKMEGVLEKEE